MESGIVQQVIPQVRPWVRYWARMLDICLFGLGAGLFLGFVVPQALVVPGYDQLFGIVTLFVWAFVEALILATFGTTPGKWLLRVRLVPTTGSTIDYLSALSRSIKVWWRGLGVGLPIVSLITLIVAHRRLTRNATTSWDKEEGFVVHHEKVGVVRALVVIAFFVVFVALIVLGSAANV